MRLSTDVRRNLRGHLRKSLIRVGVLVTVDLSAVFMGRAILRAARMGYLGAQLGLPVRSFLPAAAVSGAELAAAIVIASFAWGCYRAGDRWRDPVRILAAAGTGVLLALYSGLWHGHPGVVFARGLLIWLCLGLVLVVFRNVTFLLAQRLPRPGLVQRVLEIHASQVTPTSLSLGPHYRLVATLAADDLPNDMEDMVDWLEGGVDTILVSGVIPVRRFSEIADFALSHGCQLLTTPRATELVAVDPHRIWVRGTPLVALTAPSLRAWQLVLKRGLDVAGSLALIAVLGPLMLLVAALVKLDSAGPVLFRQRRAGLGGSFFELLKYRSMRPDAELILRRDLTLYRRYVENDFKLPENEDPRVTRVGRFLRKTSLDELPQLFNVLRGDMSLVGPRPVIEPELKMYRGRIPTFLSVKPGMTGLWQISGRSHVGFPERAAIDLEYIRHWSLLKDLWLLFMTVPAVLLGRGAH